MVAAKQPQERGMFLLLFLGVVFIGVEEVGGQTQAASFAFGSAYMSQPTGIALDPTSRRLFVIDSAYSRILIYSSIDNITSVSNPDFVLGQSVFSPSATGINSGLGPTQCNRSSLFFPQSLWVDASGTLWVTDTFNNRVLWWENAAGIQGNGIAATGVVGQGGFTTQGWGTGATELYNPSGVVVQNNILWVADSKNSRVLRLDGAASLPTSNASASGVIGGSAGGCSATQLSYPFGLLVTSQGLYVADLASSRVVFFTSTEMMLNSGATALRVYGKRNLTDCAPLMNVRADLAEPLGVAITPDGSLLVVTDHNNNRCVLYAITPPTTDGQLAADVLGQPNFTATNQGVTLSGLSSPTCPLYDSVKNKLWVTDLGNNRVVVYTNVVVLVNNNISSLNVHATFVGRSPTVYLYPKTSTGDYSPGLQQALLQPTMIEELNATGSVVQTVALPPNGYAHSSSIDSNNNQYFTFSLSTPSPITITYTLFAVASNVTSAGVAFVTNPSAMKFQIQLSNWNFLQPTNTLRLHLSINVVPAATTVTPNTFPGALGGTITQYSIASLNVMTTTVQMIGYGIADGVNVPVNFTLTNPNNGSGLDLAMSFPHFSSTFLYDPDFSVTLYDNGGDGGSLLSTNNELLPLLALLVLIVIPGILLVGTVAIVAAVWFSKWKLNWAARIERGQDQINY